jgi:hypothetical protein
MQRSQNLLYFCDAVLGKGEYLFDERSKFPSNDFIPKGMKPEYIIIQGLSGYICIARHCENHETSETG